MDSRLSEPWAEALTVLAAVFVVGVLSVIANVVAKNIIVRSVRRIATRTRFQWDNTLIKWQVFHRLSHLAPALVIYFSAPYVFLGYPGIARFFLGGSQIYMIGAGVMALDVFLNAVHEIYRTYPASRNIPIKSVVQVVKILLFFVAFILALAIGLGKNPAYLIGGLSGMGVVLMLILRGPILGFVAGIQLAGNKMVAVGDWIEMPKYGADGNVVEVGVTTVKVQNFDKTIITIPTSALVSDSFRNWRGMSESGGRRIKRCLYIDMQTIRFCDEAMLRRYSRIGYIAEYIDFKREELQTHNNTINADLEALANGRRLTNIGTFRAYVVAYLKHHPQINKEMTLLVRQLAPTSQGLPIEIYVFCADKALVDYEAIQADIFDHILAVVPEFDLRIYQEPAGNDFRGLSSSAQND